MSEETKEILVEASNALETAAVELDVAEHRAVNAEAQAEHAEERAEVIEAASVRLVEQVTEDTRLATIEGNISTWHAALETLQSSVQAGLMGLQTAVQSITDQLSQVLSKIATLEEVAQRPSLIRQPSEPEKPAINPNNLNEGAGNPAPATLPSFPVRKKRKI